MSCLRLPIHHPSQTYLGITGWVAAKRPAQQGPEVIFTLPGKPARTLKSTPHPQGLSWDQPPNSLGAQGAGDNLLPVSSQKSLA